MTDEEQLKACFKKCGVTYPEFLEDFKNEFYEDDTDAELDILQKLFATRRKRHFTISVGIKDLLKPISNEEYIIARNKKDCYCFLHQKKKVEDDLFLIRRKHQNINTKTVIDELTKQGFKSCNHVFFEGVRENDGEYILCFGS